MTKYRIESSASMLKASITVAIPLYRSPRSSRVTDKMKRAGSAEGNGNGETRGQGPEGAVGKVIGPQDRVAAHAADAAPDFDTVGDHHRRRPLKQSQPQHRGR